MGRKTLALAAVALLGAGCTINRDIMFKTPPDYAFDSVQDTMDRQFKVQPNDIISFRMFANDGFRMIDLINEDEASLRAANRTPFNYLVDPDGSAKLPLWSAAPPWPALPCDRRN
jgi:hypothetical protein